MTKADRVRKKKDDPKACEIDEVVEAVSCLDDLHPSDEPSCLTDVAGLSLDALGIGVSADNEHNDDRSWGEVDPFAPQPRRGKTPGSGRRKGSLNKKTLQRRELMAAVRASGESPITFFTQLLRNEKNPFELRFAAARELMPFMHPRLASTESRIGGKTHEDRLREAQQLLADDEPQTTQGN